MWHMIQVPMKCEGNEERHNVPQGRVILPDIIIMKEGVGG